MADNIVRVQREAAILKALATRPDHIWSTAEVAAATDYPESMTRLTLTRLAGLGLVTQQRAGYPLRWQARS